MIFHIVERYHSFDNSMQPASSDTPTLCTYTVRYGFISCPFIRAESSVDENTWFMQVYYNMNCMITSSMTMLKLIFNHFNLKYSLKDIQ